MAISSMTGFARAEGGDERRHWTWEVRSVNGKGLDLRIRLQSGYDRLEPQVRAAASRHLKRGSVSCTLQVRSAPGAVEVRINEALLTMLIETCNRRNSPPELSTLLGVRGVVEQVEVGVSDVGEVDDAVFAPLLETLDDAMRGLSEARLSEGVHLARELEDHFSTLSALVSDARNEAAAQPDAIRDRLAAQIGELLADDSPVPEERLAQEVAMMAVKADVREELDRLDAHLAAAGELLAQGGPIGRRLEFLAQELNREANTLCSKAQDIALTRIGLEMKATVDQVREQAANLE